MGWRALLPALAVLLAVSARGESGGLVWPPSRPSPVTGRPVFDNKHPSEECGRAAYRTPGPPTAMLEGGTKAVVRWEAVGEGVVEIRLQGNVVYRKDVADGEGEGVAEVVLPKVSLTTHLAFSFETAECTFRSCSDVEIVVIPELRTGELEGPGPHRRWLPPSTSSVVVSASSPATVSLAVFEALGAPRLWERHLSGGVGVAIPPHTHPLLLVFESPVARTLLVSVDPTPPAEPYQDRSVAAWQVGETTCLSWGAPSEGRWSVSGGGGVVATGRTAKGNGTVACLSTSQAHQLGVTVHDSDGAAHAYARAPGRMHTLSTDTVVVSPGTPIHATLTGTALRGATDVANGTATIQWHVTSSVKAVKVYVFESTENVCPSEPPTDASTAEGLSVGLAYPSLYDERRLLPAGRYCVLVKPVGDQPTQVYVWVRHHTATALLPGVRGAAAHAGVSYMGYDEAAGVIRIKYHASQSNWGPCLHSIYIYSGSFADGVGKLRDPEGVEQHAVLLYLDNSTVLMPWKKTVVLRVTTDDLPAAVPLGSTASAPFWMTVVVVDSAGRKAAYTPLYHNLCDGKMCSPPQRSSQSSSVVAVFIVVAVLVVAALVGVVLLYRRRMNRMSKPADDSDEPEDAPQALEPKGNTLGAVAAASQDEHPLMQCPESRDPTPPPPASLSPPESSMAPVQNRSVASSGNSAELLRPTPFTPSDELSARMQKQRAGQS